MLAGYNVIITGATGGLGRAMSVAFWKAGASLLLTGRSQKKLDELSRLLPAEAGRTLHFLECDLSGPDGCDSLIEFASRCFPAVDVLVNNAATLGPAGPLWENDWHAWNEAMRLNLLAPVQLCRAIIRMMHRGGTILNISGGGATSPRPNFSAYGSSKAALVRFSETLAVEAAPLGVRVNCIAPGIMRSRMVEQVVECGAATCGSEEFTKALGVMEKGGTSPETPAELAVLLASDLGKAITGRLISAAWDPWRELPSRAADLVSSDVYTLRRILPSDRGLDWNELTR